MAALKKTGIVVGALVSMIIFGWISAQETLPHRALIEAFVLWVMPWIVLALIAETKLQKARFGWFVLLGLTVGLIASEYLGLSLRNFPETPTSMSQSDWYQYRAFYVLIGPIQLIIFSALYFIHKTATISRTVGLTLQIPLIVLATWLFFGSLAEYRPVFSNHVWPCVLFLSIVWFGGAYSLFRQRLQWKYSVSFVLALFVFFMFF